MIAMAICAVQLPAVQAIGSIPSRFSTTLASPPEVLEKMEAKTSVAATREVAYGMIIEIRKKLRTRML